MKPPATAYYSRARILALWFPLALTWAMMAAEGLIIESVISRLSNAAPNLAALGVAISIAFIVESPVIMLLSASTAYIKGAGSYRALRRFSLLLSLGTSGVMVLLTVPPVFAFVSRTLLALPPSIEHLVHQCLAAFIPWPAAIGVRRFYQGVIIRTHRTAPVAWGTAFRLLTIVTGSLLLATVWRSTSQSSLIGALILNAAVTIEMVASRLMAQEAIGHVLSQPDPEDYQLTLPRITTLYTPLALTSLITMGIGPILTGFMARFPAAIASLAVFPIVDNFVFQFRSPLFAYQEVAISLFGSQRALHRDIIGVGYRIAAVATLLLLTATLPPVAQLVYGVFPYKLGGELVAYATVATALLLPLPVISALYSIERALLITQQQPQHVTYSTLIEAGSTVVLLALLAAVKAPLPGIYAACLAVIGGKVAAAAYLHRQFLRYRPRVEE